MDIAFAVPATTYDVYDVITTLYHPPLLRSVGAIASGSGAASAHESSLRPYAQR